MSERSEVYLRDRRTKALVRATLVDALTSDEVIRAQETWRPALEEAIERWSAAGLPRGEWPQHAHGDWQTKASRVRGLLAYQFVGIECQEQFQGLMLLDLAGRESRIDIQEGKPLVYVAYLSTAPWNSPDFVDEPRYSLIGQVLIAAAIQISYVNGFYGRIGLHSLPQADSFYRRCGMSDLGSDPEAETLRYFEMTPEQAARFLGHGEPS